MAVRRSARLRSRQASSEEPQLPVDPVNNNNNSHTGNTDQNTTNTHNTLPSVMERDEAPVVDAPPQPTATAPAATTPSTSSHLRTPLKSTPQPKITTPSVAVNRGSPLKSTPAQKTPSQKTPSQKTPSQKTPAQKTPLAQTPTSVLTRPPHQEMHPSKVHQSTTKQADSGLILGFNPVKKDAEGNVVKESLVQDTPSKARASPASTTFGTPGFDFKFACHESQLSEEAKKLMESVRQDAAKIKSQMTLDKKDDDSQKDDQQAGDRRIAHPKGKSSRFSNAHMAEFRKMDSIAGHASAFRAVPGRFQPVQKTLKRTNSKARLDESDKASSPSKTATPKPAAATSTATPAATAAANTKRVKHVKTDDTSTNRPTQGEPRTPSRATHTRPRSTVRNSLMTPTAASAARATYTNIKPPRASMIPSLARSPSVNQSSAPRTPRTDFNPRFKTNIPSLPNLKSILRRHQPLFSKDPSKIAAGTHVAAPDFDSKLLMGSSRDASEDPVQTPSPKKRVEFSASTRSPAAEASPSPSKAPAVMPPPISDIVYPTLPVLTPDHAVSKSANAEPKPTIRQVRPSEAAPSTISAPDVAGVPHGIGNKKRHRATADETDAENVPPVDSTPEARSTKRVKLSSPSPTKMPTQPTPSPTKARIHTPMRSSSNTSRSGTPASVRQRNRGILSMSRLNMLARPKNRP